MQFCDNLITKFMIKAEKNGRVPITTEWSPAINQLWNEIKCLRRSRRQLKKEIKKFINRLHHPPEETSEQDEISTQLHVITKKLNEALRKIRSERRQAHNLRQQYLQDATTIALLNRNMPRHKMLR